MILLGWGLHSLVYADEHTTNPKQQVHDDVKDKEFELELSWVCEESGWTHKQVARMLQQREIPRCSFFFRSQTPRAQARDGMWCGAREAQRRRHRAMSESPAIIEPDL